MMVNQSSIQTLLSKEQAVLIAHYYVNAEIQQLAQDTGGIVADSLEMARFGAEHPAKTLIVCGVRFMGETAKILSPNKRVLMPTLEATCSLDEGCPSDDFEIWRSQHPDRTVVVYANTSAAIKAQADWVVTSSIALEVVQHLHERGQSILWAPDQHLGRYVQHKTGADMKLWEGECIVHREFQAQALIDLKTRNPEAAVLVHPESPLNVIELADVVGSTQHLLSAVQSRPERVFIVATDQGLFYAMQAAAPDKQLILAPTTGRHATCQACGSCPWMQMNSVEKIEAAFNQAHHEIFLDDSLIYQASKPLIRMLAFKKQMLT